MEGQGIKKIANITCKKCNISQKNSSLTFSMVSIGAKNECQYQNQKSENQENPFLRNPKMGEKCLMSKFWVMLELPLAPDVNQKPLQVLIEKHKL